MTTFDETQRIEAETKRLLDEVLGDAIHQSRSEKSLEISQRRRWFAIGLLLLAPFCISVASFLATQVDSATGVIWVYFAVALLIVGGWQFDKANKEAIAVKSPRTSDFSIKPVRGIPPRRVK